MTASFLFATSNSCQVTLRDNCSNSRKSTNNTGAHRKDPIPKMHYEWKSVKTSIQISSVTYIYWIVQRLYPQLPVNVRVTAKTTILPSGGGPDGNSPVLIRKGTGVGWSTYHMHRMASTFGLDANEFVPERWADGELEKSVGIGYMNFHAWPRMCLGSKLGYLWDRIKTLIKCRGICTLGSIVCHHQDYPKHFQI